MPDESYQEDLIYVLRDIRDVLAEIRDEIHEFSERLERLESEH